MEMKERLKNRPRDHCANSNNEVNWDLLYDLRCVEDQSYAMTAPQKCNS